MSSSDESPSTRTPSLGRMPLRVSERWSRQKTPDRFTKSESVKHAVPATPAAGGAQAGLTHVLESAPMENGTSYDVNAPPTPVGSGTGHPVPDAPAAGNHVPAGPMMPAPGVDISSSRRLVAEVEAPPAVRANRPFTHMAQVPSGTERGMPPLASHGTPRGPVPDRPTMKVAPQSSLTTPSPLARVQVGASPIGTILTPRVTVGVPSAVQIQRSAAYPAAWQYRGAQPVMQSPPVIYRATIAAGTPVIPPRAVAPVVVMQQSAQGYILPSPSPTPVPSGSKALPSQPTPPQPVQSQPQPQPVLTQTFRMMPLTRCPVGGPLPFVCAAPEVQQVPLPLRAESLQAAPGRTRSTSPVPVQVQVQMPSPYLVQRSVSPAKGTPFLPTSYTPVHTPTFPSPPSLGLPSPVKSQRQVSPGTAFPWTAAAAQPLVAAPAVASELGAAPLARPVPRFISAPITSSSVQVSPSQSRCSSPRGSYPLSMSDRMRLVPPSASLSVPSSPVPSQGRAPIESPRREPVATKTQAAPPSPDTESDASTVLRCEMLERTLHTSKVERGALEERLLATSEELEAVRERMAEEVRRCEKQLEELGRQNATLQAQLAEKEKEAALSSERACELEKEAVAVSRKVPSRTTSLRGTDFEGDSDNGGGTGDMPTLAALRQRLYGSRRSSTNSASLNIAEGAVERATGDRPPHATQSSRSPVHTGSSLRDPKGTPPRGRPVR